VGDDTEIPKLLHYIFFIFLILHFTKLKNREEITAKEL
jgi:hypothetical protein